MTTEEYLAIEPNALIEDLAETLLRQVHPDHRPNGVLSKQAFVATKEHDYLLSTKREAFGAVAAYEAHKKKRLTCGTWGVTVGTAKKYDLPSVDDAEHVGEKAHASISFLDVATDGQRAQRARKLRDAAACLHGPFVSTSVADNAGVAVDGAKQSGESAASGPPTGL